ncbi:MAG: LPS-assembly protein LptD, partial [Spirochaetes bacterium]|nr:LPS-assembly protein LptD [Spirochaetota bacterium]
MYKLLATLYFTVIIFGSYAVPLESFTGLPGTEETPDLIAQTLSEDISTASYYELLSWSHNLSLKETGSRKELQQRLMKYYNVKPPAVVQGEKRIIEIESAKETEYFTIESIKENYVVLRGDVVLTIQDKEKNIKHTIKADKIIFNQTENTVTARGNVEYRLRSASREEVFKGESISFNLNNWEGIFYRGKTEREQEQGGKKITYFFKGKEIIRKKNDVVILNNGSITSCALKDNPHYHIKAKKIWVLAPGEWAIQNAILYIGRVPVMAIPFFFYPGDKLFFHPAIGYRDREGNYIQTTTYLIGRKKQNSSPVSFLNLNQGENGEYKEYIKGLFLYKSKKILNKPNEDFLKVFIDLYSRLGAFTGIEGSFNPDANFKGGIAVSRDLFYNTLTDLYTPFYMDENGKLVSIWNSSYLLGIPVPFRYGVSSNIKSNIGIFSFSGNIELYSDPYFSEDFYNRSEGLDWNAILSGQNTEPASGIIKNNLLWFLNMKVNMTNLIKSSLLSSLSFPYINIKYSIQSKDKTIADTDTISSVDPSRRFYYPLSLKIPEISLNAGGTIYNSGDTGTVVKNRAVNKRGKLKDPG